MTEIPNCYKCHSPLFSVELTNKDRRTWCNCDKIGVPDGWSGYIEKKRFWKDNKKPYTGRKR